MNYTYNNNRKKKNTQRHTTTPQKAQLATTTQHGQELPKGIVACFFLQRCDTRLGRFLKNERLWLVDRVNPTLWLDERVWDRRNLTSLNWQLHNETMCDHGEPMHFWAVQSMHSLNITDPKCSVHYQQQIMSSKKYIWFATFWTNEISFWTKYSFVIGCVTWARIALTRWNCPHENASAEAGSRDRHINTYISVIYRSRSIHFSPALRFFSIS